MRHVVPALVLVLVAAGCARKDTSVPPVPVLDPVPVSTELTAVVISGSAQYLAKMTVQRTPAFANNEAPAPVFAGQYTSRFSFTVPLALGKNVISVVAANQNGPSQPATITITRAKAAPAALALTIASTVVDADSGTLEARAQVTNPEPIDLSSFQISFTATADGVTPPLTVTATATTDAQGRAAATLTGLTHPGSWTLVAASTDNPGATDEASFAVLAGAAAKVALTLSASPASGAVSGAAITVPAGTPVSAQVTVTDADGNTTAVPAHLSTDAPGAFIQGNQISGLTQAAAQPWTVVATISPDLFATATVTVTAADPANLVANPTSAVAGQTVALSLTDAYGNPADAGQTAWTLAAFACSDATCQTTSADATAVMDETQHTAVIDRAGTERIALQLGASTSLQTQVAVAPAAPNKVALTATPAQGTLAALPAGTTITLAATVEDTFGNDTGLPVIFSTDAPGALMVPPLLTGATKAGGPYQVVATALGLSLSASQSFTVIPGPATQLNLTLAQDTASADDTVRYTAVPADVYGNPTADAVTLTATEGNNPVALDGTQGTWTADAGAHGQRGSLQVYLAGSATVTANDPSASIQSSASLRVEAGLPATLAIQGFPQQIQAGQTASFTYLVQDDHGNTVSGTPVTATTSAPDAILTLNPRSLSGTLQGVVRPGSYSVVLAAAATGLSSSPAAFTVVPGPATSIDLVLSSPATTADVPIYYRARPLDAYGNPTTDLVTITAASGQQKLKLDGTDGTWTATAGSNGQSGSLQIYLAGAATVTATDPSANVNATAPLAVAGGSPAAVTVTSFTQPLTSGGTANFSYSVTDDHDNSLAGTPMAVVTNAPGALTTLDPVAMTGTVSGVTTAGTYSLVLESIASGLTSAAFSFTVGPAPATTLRFSLATTNAAIGVAVPFTFSLVDAAGNPVSSQPTSISLTLLPAPGTAPDVVQGQPSNALNDTITFNSVGTYTVQAKVTVGGTTYTNSATVADVYSGIDTTPPAVTTCVGTFTNKTDPSSCQAGSTNYAPGDDISVEVMALDADGSGVAEVLLQARGAFSADYSQLESTPNQGQTLETFLVHVSGNSAYGTLSLVGAATDPQGNMGVSAPVRVTIQPNGNNWGAGSGYTLQMVAGGPGSTLNQPWGLAVRRGLLYVANHGDHRIVQVDPQGTSGTGSTAVDLSNVGGNSYRPIDIIYNAGTSQVGLNDGFVISTNQNRLLTWQAGSGPGSVSSYTTGYGGTANGLNWEVGTSQPDQFFTFAEDSNDQAHQSYFAAGPQLKESYAGGNWPAFSRSVNNGPSNLWDAVAVVADFNGQTNHAMAFGTFRNNGCGYGSGGVYYYDLNGGWGDALDGSCGTLNGHVDTPRGIIFVDGANGPALLYANNSPAQNQASIVRVPLNASTLRCPSGGCNPETVAWGLNAVGLTLINSNTLAITDDQLNAVFVVTGTF